MIQELELKGKGVERVRIDKLDKLADVYLKLKEEASKLSSRVSDARGKLIDSMHEHADKLEQPDGDLIYKRDGLIVSLIAGAEKLKVEEVKEAKG